MSQELVETSGSSNLTVLSEPATDLVTFILGNQLFGIPVLQVQDVLQPQKIARVPLAPPQICGSINLRGKIVTALHMRNCLKLPPDTTITNSMFIVVEYKGELYSLMVDRVGDVMSLPTDKFEPNPINLDPTWRSVAGGVYRLDGKLLVVLDVGHLLDLVYAQNGALSS
jgi:purine-binding chemotaxis protein CheW